MDRIEAARDETKSAKKFFSRINGKEHKTVNMYCLKKNRGEYTESLEDQMKKNSRNSVPSINVENKQDAIECFQGFFHVRKEPTFERFCEILDKQASFTSANPEDMIPMEVYKNLKAGEKVQ